MFISCLPKEVNRIIHNYEPTNELPLISKNLWFCDLEIKSNILNKIRDLKIPLFKFLEAKEPIIINRDENIFEQATVLNRLFNGLYQCARTKSPGYQKTYSKYGRFTIKCYLKLDSNIEKHIKDVASAHLILQEEIMRYFSNFPKRGKDIHPDLLSMPNCYCPQELAGPKYLKELDCLKSSIQSGTVSYNKSGFISLRKSVFRLDLSSNNLKYMGQFSCLNNLVNLNLSNNRLVDIKPLLSLRELKYLDLSNNNIMNISGLSSLRNLRILDLSNNKLTCIFHVLEDMPLLHDLDLSKNKIDGYFRDFLSMPELRNLNLSFNYYKKLPSDLLIMQRGLRVNFSYNLIDSIDKKYLVFPFFSHINLSYNYIDKDALPCAKDNLCSLMLPPQRRKEGPDEEVFDFFQDATAGGGAK